MGQRTRSSRKKPAGLYKKGSRRADWKQREMGEAPTMVRGTNRRVVVVRSPDPKIFEEAIFVVREDLFRRESSADKVMGEARRAARAYLDRAVGTKRRPLLARIPAAIYAGLGALAAALAWLAFRLVGV